VILGRLGLGPKPTIRRRVDITAGALWVCGIFLYHALAHWAPAYGSTLPTLAFTFFAATLTRQRAAAAVETGR
jgi:hypothetical protein